MSYEIEKGVEPPRVGKKQKYPWSKMSVGDSFFVPCEGDTRRVVANNTSNAGRIWTRANKPDCRISSHQVDGGVRVWLIKRES